jgi:ABC-2 type transport system ATP-binding protein
MAPNAPVEGGEISAENLHKRFGGTVAVHDVSFEVMRGEVVGFLGPNGAGKSTTLRMITGVFPPSSGRCRVASHDVVRETLRARKSIGYLPERATPYGDMAVERYLRFIAGMKQLPAREVTPAVRRAMGATDLEHVSHRLVGTLSKGYRQRVGIAQAILGDPPVLILDEPTSGLDPEQVSEIRNLIRGLGDDKRTVVLSTHILPEVEMICSRVIILAAGRILAVDQPSRLEARLRPYREYSARIGGPLDGALAAVRRIPHVVHAERRAVAAESNADIELRIQVEHGFDVRREISSALVGGGFGLLELKPNAMTLEEIFLTLVGESAAEKENHARH